YVGAYAGLTLLGAAIGLAVNALFPPFPLAPARQAVARLRRAVADHLDTIASHFDTPEGPFPQNLRSETIRVHHARLQMHSSVDLAEQAAWGHLFRRARRIKQLDELRRGSNNLDRIVIFTADLSDMLLHHSYRPEETARILGLSSESRSEE